MCGNKNQNNKIMHEYCLNWHEKNHRQRERARNHPLPVRKDFVGVWNISEMKFIIFIFIRVLRCVKTYTPECLRKLSEGLIASHVTDKSVWFEKFRLFDFLSRPLTEHWVLGETILLMEFSSINPFVLPSLGVSQTKTTIDFKQIQGWQRAKV